MEQKGLGLHELYLSLVIVFENLDHGCVCMLKGARQKAGDYLKGLSPIQHPPPQMKVSFLLDSSAT